MKSVFVNKDRSGDEPATIQHVVNLLKALGHHGAVALRADGEPALQEMFNKVAAAIGKRTIVEQGPRQDGQANGRAERAVRSIEEMVRVLKATWEIARTRQWTQNPDCSSGWSGIQLTY